MNTYDYKQNDEYQQFLNKGNIQQDFESFCESQNENYDSLINNQQYKSDNYEVIHKVTVEDTLEGLSLQYGVNSNVIKQYNNLQNDFIYLLKEIKIPNPKDYYESNQTKDQDDTLKQLQILYFMNAILKGEDKNQKVAKYYLDGNDYNLENASQEYELDLKFEKNHEKIQKEAQQKGQQKQPIVNKKNKTKVELISTQHKQKYD